MKRIFAAAVIAMLWTPTSALANERLGGVAIGALAGAVVLGPVGAIAGAAIGYGAGSAVANSRSAGPAPAPQRRQDATKPPRRAIAQQVPLPQPKPAALEARAQAVPPVAKQTPAKDPAPPAKPAVAAAAPSDALARMVPH